jgi:two-component system, OmpR family, response regulator VicR
MGEKILIIEDEVPIADLLQFSLQQEGYDVNVAYDGKEGLYKLKNFNPDLLILDLMLPDMDGFDICKFSAHNFNMPIIIITAKSDIVDKILGLELGADDYISATRCNMKSIA